MGYWDKTWSEAAKEAALQHAQDQFSQSMKQAHAQHAQMAAQQQAAYWQQRQAMAASAQSQYSGMFNVSPRPAYHGIPRLPSIYDKLDPSIHRQKIVLDINSSPLGQKRVGSLWSSKTIVNEKPAEPLRRQIEKVLVKAS